MLVLRSAGLTLSFLRSLGLAGWLLNEVTMMGFIYIYSIHGIYIYIYIVILEDIYVYKYVF